MIVATASLINAPLPILPLQILLLNIISDVFPALALGLGEGSENVMKFPPRNPKEPILTFTHWFAIFGYGVLIAVTVLLAFAAAVIWLKMDHTRAVTVSFLTLAFARLWHIFNMRESGTNFLRNEIVINKFVWMAIVLCTVLLLAAVYTPGISDVLKLTGPDLKQWMLILGGSLVPFAVGQVLKSVKIKSLKVSKV
jgi:Ca2+-transporting ATPase